MTTNEVKELILSAKSIKRESERIKQEIEQRREELLSIQSTMGGGDRVMSSEKLSMPERVYFSLEKLYTQYSEVLQRLHDKNNQIESAIASLDPLEQEIVRAWIDGKTEEQIGVAVGYTRPTIARYKRRILVKLTRLKS
ncbi:hypothetical protein [Anaerocaecibacter muris]|uniref:hypothetical protein n=1 Tax=Anaerocaecibacter muris TaxID=2941513 RepID=UPI003F68C441